jgi:hypothetical protein
MNGTYPEASALDAGKLMVKLETPIPLRLIPMLLDSRLRCYRPPQSSLLAPIRHIIYKRSLEITTEPPECAFERHSHPRDEPGLWIRLEPRAHAVGAS